VVNGEMKSMAEEEIVERCGRGGIMFGRDLVEDRMTAGLQKLPKEFGKVAAGLAESVVNKPTRSWIGSCSTGENENLELARMEHRC